MIAGSCDEFRVRGGWLASEVGMGKTLCSIAVVLANPLVGSVQPPRSAVTTPSRWGRDKPFFTSPLPKRKPTWGVTLILAPNSLLGQWQDEIGKWAPQLRVVNLHGSGGRGAPDVVVNADVLLTTPNSATANTVVYAQPIHRLIIDEAHTLGKTDGEVVSLMARIGARHVWLVSGTPMSTSYDDLLAGSYLLGHVGHGLHLFDKGRGNGYLPHLPCRQEKGMRNDKTLNAELVQKLRKLMIRHTKCMRCDATRDSSRAALAHLTKLRSTGACALVVKRPSRCQSRTQRPCGSP